MNPYSPPAAVPPYPDAAVYGAPPGLPAGAVTDLAVDMLRQTRPWVILLSIMSFLGAGFMLLAGLLMVGVGLMASGPEKAIQAALGAFYIPFGAIYVYPGIKMWMYGSAIGRLLTSRSPGDLEAALKQQKHFWKFCGIAAIVMVVAYFLIFIGAMVWGVATGLGHR
jgi:hypothetical protein